MSEKVVLVDINDKPLGEMEKIKAHKEAALHRAVSVFIFNSKQQLLLQQRALEKYHSPGLWTNTACTHPQLNENVIDAGIRRLQEEMGINISKLTKLFDFVYKETFENGLTEYEFDHVYVGVSDDLPIPNPDEVCNYKYVDMDSLLKHIESSPDDYTVWFKKIINRVVEEVRDVA